MGDDYDIIQLAKTQFKSVPLFLPNTVQYDKKTNLVSESINNIDGSDSTREELVLVPGAGLDILQSIDKPVSFIACIGPYRTGKSFLLSRFLKDSKAFELGSTLEGCTRGIWISTSAIIRKEAGREFYTFLLDCEGAGDPLEGDDASNARIALVCILLASVFIFNNVGRPDRSSLQFLSYLETIRKRIPTKNLSSSPLFFPSFLWIFRDFFLQLPVNKDTGRTYTLKEYMLDRVLIKPQSKHMRGSGDELVVMDCILSDFLSFDVASISNPQKKNGNDQFTPEELSRLNDFDWTEFHQDFQDEVQNVISLCLSKASPFRLDHSSENTCFSKGPEFSLWCQQVEKLVNSEEVLPDIPDIQQQLLTSLSVQATDEAIETYKNEMTDFLDSCPTFNSEDDKHVQVLVEEQNFDGVANENEIQSCHQKNVANGRALLEKQIPSRSMFEDYAGKYESEVLSIYTRFVERNEKRSKRSCEQYAKFLYSKLKLRVKEDPTNIVVDEFQQEAETIIKVFKSCARGPCVDEIVTTYLAEQVEADRIFLEKVHSLNSKYHESLKEQEYLRMEIIEKSTQVGQLEKKFEETEVEHQAVLQRKEEEKTAALDNMKNEHCQALNDAIQKEKERQELELASFQIEMECKLSEAESERQAEVSKIKSDLESFKLEAQNLLDEEVARRDERLKREESAHNEEVQRLLLIADENMKKEILAGEIKRKTEKEAFQKKMDEMMQAQQNKLNEEIEKREEEFRRRELKHQEDLKKEKREMEKKIEQERLRMEEANKKERKQYESRIEELEDKCPCSIM